MLNILGELAGRVPHDAVREWTYQTATSGGYWVRHLWFLIVLLYLSILSAAAVAAVPKLERWRLGAAHDERLAAAAPVLLPPGDPGGSGPALQ